MHLLHNSIFSLVKLTLVLPLSRSFLYGLVSRPCHLQVFNWSTSVWVLPVLEESWQVIRFIFQFPMRQNWVWIPHFNMKSAMKTERVLKSTLQWCAPHFSSKQIILYDKAYEHLPRNKHKVFKPQNQNLVPLWVAY